MVVQYTKKDEKIVEAKLLLVEEKDLKDGYKLKIPEGITVIGNGSFQNIKTVDRVYGRRNLKIKMPDTVTRIEEGAFSFLSIDKIKFSKNLKEIEGEAFRGTIFLQDIELPEELETISDSCFRDCNFEGKVKLPKKLNKIDEGAFNRTIFKKKLIITEKVKEIPEYCFAKSHFYEGISLPEGLEKIDHRAFYAAVINQIKIPDSVTEIGYCVFKNSSIERVKLSNSLTRIPMNSFSETQLSEIEIPEKVVGIEVSAFHDTKLTKAIFHNGLRYIEDYSFANTLLEEVNLPQTLQKIGYGCFASCTFLNIINFPESLKTIESCAFYKSGLEEVILPKNIEVEESAFADSNIKKVILSETEYNQVGKNGAFKGNPLSLVEVYNHVNIYENRKVLPKYKVKKLGR